MKNIKWYNFKGQWVSGYPMIRKYKDNKEYTNENGLNTSFYSWLSMVLLLNSPLIHLIYFHSFGLLYLVSFRDKNSKYLSIMIYGFLPVSPLLYTLNTSGL